MTIISIDQRTWLTTEEAAEYLRISTKTLLRAIKNMQFSYGHEYAKKNPRQKRSQFIFHKTRLEKLENIAFNLQKNEGLKLSKRL